MIDFSSFSHLSKWIFKQESEIESIRSGVRDKALGLISNIVGPDHVPCLEDEKWMISYFAYQLTRISKAKYVKHVVLESALAIFNRFYIKRSALEYDPRYVIFTCLSLALKAEDCWKAFTVRDLLGDLPELDPEKVFELEPKVCDGIDFSLFIFHSRDSIYWLKQECGRYLGPNFGSDTNTESFNITKEIAIAAQFDCIYMYECPEILLLYTPAQIALAAFYQQCSVQYATVLSVDQFMQRRIFNNDTERWESAKIIICKIQTAYDSYKPYRKEIMSKEGRDRTDAILERFVAIYEKTKCNMNVD
ncbi:cyclin H [Babesia microti strain RI]|uniref:Cyclin H n=1 Tax=Babesia microti (strain RI) TaxID=1133968 RepID=A0A1R4AAQ8_BABMR|nr:cyclin H [Babesia microti strain RI]SJK86067.1 cyclin H [Babesia microti strain RI]|eukprot:XP_021338263.1 cyclin H [Babesia microti strain RI]